MGFESPSSATVAERPHPLVGWRVAITRPKESGDELERALARIGARPLVTPLLRLVPVEDQRPLRRALARLGADDWILFTSANAVRIVALLLGAGSSFGRRPRIAAVGPATAAALGRSGIGVDHVASVFDGETVAATLPITPGVRVLHPRSALARSIVPDVLRARGAEVDDLDVYTLRPGTGGPALVAAIRAGGVDGVTVFSPSAVAALADLAIPSLLLPPVVAIGPVTAREAMARRIPIAAIAERYDGAGVLAALTGLAGRPASGESS